MKVAIVHYWLLGMRGGEKVLEELCRLYPGAVIFTHAVLPEALSPTILRHEIRTSFISRLPGGQKNPQRWLPLMPRALEALDLTEFDLVISSEAGPAKGVIVRPDALHLCYCHSPMRYIWDQYPIYYAEAGLLGRAAMRAFAHRLRQWDTASAARPDAIAANSAYVAQRIAKAWRRPAEVIAPPVDVDAFRPEGPLPEGEFYLLAGEITAYKRPDLAIEAFTRSGRRLVVIGEGSARAGLQARAGANVSFLGKVPFEVLKDHYARCRALVFPGVEDFGIMPVEVMASGRPVIAYRRGGACETVIDGQTGLFFDRQDPAALNAAIDRFEEMPEQFVPGRLVEQARTFSAERFRERFTDFVARSRAELDRIGRPQPGPPA